MAGMQAFKKKHLIYALTLALAPVIQGCSVGSPSAVEVNGSGVKGPLANANVTVYSFDSSVDGFKGSVIASAQTNENAQIVGLEVPSSATPPFIMEYTSVPGTTTDITTGAFPVITTMRTVITQSHIDNGENIYATPLTTMATDLAFANADNNQAPWTGDADNTTTEAELLAALPTAANQVLSTFGFGASNDVDVFNTPPMMDDSTQSTDQQQQVAEYRLAVEALAAVAFGVQQNTDGTTTDEVLSAITADLSDGAIDGSPDGGATTSSILTIANIQILTQDPTQLLIPGTTIPVTQIINILEEETQQTGVSTPVNSEEIEVAPEPAETNPDKDGDGVLNADDAFPDDPSESIDTDNDGIGNNADTDDDGDNVSDTDEETNGTNPLLPDTDDDGVNDDTDAFPLDDTETLDTDNDGIGNNADTDDDGDGVKDSLDAFPLDSSETLDTDNDGIGNNADTDDDGDGISDEDDPAPLDADITTEEGEDNNAPVFETSQSGTGTPRIVDANSADGAYFANPKELWIDVDPDKDGIAEVDLPDISAEKSTFDSSAKSDADVITFVKAILDKRYPTGWYNIEREAKSLQDGENGGTVDGIAQDVEITAVFDHWSLDRSSASSIISGLGTTIHEAGHMWDGQMRNAVGTGSNRYFVAYDDNGTPDDLGDDIDTSYDPFGLHGAGTNSSSPYPGISRSTVLLDDQNYKRPPALKVDDSGYSTVYNYMSPIEAPTGDAPFGADTSYTSTYLDDAPPATFPNTVREGEATVSHYVEGFPGYDEAFATELTGNYNSDFASGDQGWNVLFEEVVQYAHSISWGYWIHDQGGGFSSNKHAMLQWLWWSQRYLRLTRMHYPDEYQWFLDNGWAEPMLVTWGQAWRFLDTPTMKAQHHYAPLYELVTSDIMLGEIQLLREFVAGSSYSQGSELVSDYTRNEYSSSSNVGSEPDGWTTWVPKKDTDSWDGPTLRTGVVISLADVLNEDYNDTTTVIYDANATDADGDTITYSISGDEATYFSIDESNGELRLSSAENGFTTDSDDLIELTITATANGQSTSKTISFNLILTDVVAPTITAVSIPDTDMIVGDTVTVTITVEEDSDDYTSGAGAISGTIGEYTLTNFTKVNDTTYTAEFTITNGGDDIAAEDDIPVNFTITDAADNESDSYTVAINQENDEIIANVPDITLSVDTSTIAEDGGEAIVTATLSEAAVADVTVNLSYSGTATAGTDYTKSDTITIATGDSSGTTTITASEDALYDAAEDETIIVAISSVQGANEASEQQVTVAITDAESAPTVTLSVSHDTILEDGGSSAITATLSHPTYEAVTVELAYSGDAVAGTDYATPSDSIAISAGSSTANASTGITSIDDEVVGADETITIDIQNVSGGGASEEGSQQATITIDNDHAPEFATEGSGSLPLIVDSNSADGLYFANPKELWINIDTDNNGEADGSFPDISTEMNDYDTGAYGGQDNESAIQFVFDILDKRYPLGRKNIEREAQVLHEGDVAAVFAHWNLDTSSADAILTDLGTTIHEAGHMWDGNQRDQAGQGSSRFFVAYDDNGTPGDLGDDIDTSYDPFGLHGPGTNSSSPYPGISRSTVLLDDQNYKRPPTEKIVTGGMEDVYIHMSPHEGDGDFGSDYSYTATYLDDAPYCTFPNTDREGQSTVTHYVEGFPTYDADFAATLEDLYNEDFASGDQGWNVLFEEVVQYSHSLAWGYYSHDPESSSTNSNKHAMLQWLWWSQRYLRLTRMHYPEEYQYFLDNGWAEPFLVVWGQAWRFLDTPTMRANQDHYAPLYQLVTNDLMLGEVQLLREHVAGSAYSQGSELVSDYTRNEFSDPWQEDTDNWDGPTLKTGLIISLAEVLNEDYSDTTTVIYDADATDEEGDTITYSISGDEVEYFTIDENSGELRLSATENAFSTNSGDIIELTITASAGGKESSLKVSLTFELEE